MSCCSVVLLLVYSCAGSVDAGWYIEWRSEALADGVAAGGWLTDWWDGEQSWLIYIGFRLPSTIQEEIESLLYQIVFKALLVGSSQLLRPDTTRTKI